jgi:hypothetical protein
MNNKHKNVDFYEPRILDYNYMQVLYGKILMNDELILVNLTAVAKHLSEGTEKIEYSCRLG